MGILIPKKVVFILGLAPDVFSCFMVIMSSQTDENPCSVGLHICCWFHRRYVLWKAKHPYETKKHNSKFSSIYISKIMILYHYVVIKYKQNESVIFWIHTFISMVLVIYHIARQFSAMWIINPIIMWHKLSTDPRAKYIRNTIFV